MGRMRGRVTQGGHGEERGMGLGDGGQWEGAQAGPTRQLPCIIAELGAARHKGSAHLCGNPSHRALPE